VREGHRFGVLSTIVLVLAAAIAAAPDFAVSNQGSTSIIPTLEATPLPELAGGSNVTGGGGNWQAGIVLSGRTREAAGPWKACVWSIVSEWPWNRFDLPSLNATLSSGALIAGLAPSDSDTVIVAAGFSYLTQNSMKPIVWHKSMNDTQWTTTPLPTLAGLEGAVLSIIDDEGSVQGILGEESNDLVGWSSATGPVDKAVLWTPGGDGGWVVRMLLHYAPGLPGRAHDGFVSAAEETTVCGWALSSEGDTSAVLWKKSTAAWTMTALPLLEGGTQGMANSIFGDGGHDLVGWSENAAGEHRGVLWYYDGVWHIEELDQPVGFVQSVPILGDS